MKKLKRHKGKAQAKTKKEKPKKAPAKTRKKKSLIRYTT